MKLKRVKIENFKGIKGPIEHSFETRPGYICPVTAVVGDNGSGKTSVLQAIGMVLAMATSKSAAHSKPPKLYIESFTDFKWFGFIPERISSLGPTHIELDVVLDRQEVGDFRNIHDKIDFDPPEWGEDWDWDKECEFTLSFKDGKIEVNSNRLISQLMGDCFISYWRRLSDAQSKVFWFEQERCFQSINFNAIRQNLMLSWVAHTAKEKNRDIIQMLEEHLSLVFPNTSFVGAEPKEQAGMKPLTPDDFYFNIRRNDLKCDLEELSSGEQAVFTLLYEFIVRQIKKSIILIDELELHLHPPEQQTLLANLTKIGPDCQFIFTTHSQSIVDVMPDEHIFRLPGGRLCL